MTSRLGTVAPNGATYFAHANLNEVREFLREAGLECGRIGGWRSQDGKLLGAIYEESVPNSTGIGHGGFRFCGAWWQQ